ncbi:hypothetical protein SteCoe_20623 [Stentor coeruleus]|uniref:Uncharacterized protein n=1 Tax=Stentor coeruleus TaxID=5963 RepID=A0A1R2BRK9_9CILI|nr:hypothetical protein SteCoe_20623 [Stentor coeruleus]
MGAFLTKRSKAQILKDSFKNKFKAELLTKMKIQVQDTKVLKAPKLQLDSNTSYTKRINARNKEQNTSFSEVLVSFTC